MKNGEYTQLVINKITKEVENTVVEPIVSLANPEFLAGAEYMKKEVLRTLKTIII